MPGPFKGRVEHIKRYRTAAFQQNRDFIFGVQLDYSCGLKSVSSDATRAVALAVMLALDPEGRF